VSERLKHVAIDVPITTHPYITECLTRNPRRRRDWVAVRTCRTWCAYHHWSL